ncbi:MAG TPA: HAMP domain-containing sensor histidine kinase [Rhizomicrobium sp.]|nr:HAMP domain-containing sensor histidine kinase [Rhizomicrobium sp.]
MFREKLVATLSWSALCITAAMLADYVLTVVILNDRANYTPLTTFIIATIVTFPTSYALVSGSIDLRRAHDQLAAARDAAVQADRTKTQFFANMSHELRTPLNAILGFSELLALDVFAPRRKEYADLIHNAGGHLLSLVNDLLDLSRIEAGKLELRTEPVDLAALIDDCVQTVALRARARDLRLIQNVTPGLPPVQADRRAFTQILFNLLTNAIKFSQPHGVVEAFAFMNPAGDVVFGVRDEGAGIAEEEQSHVFERYGQARRNISGEKGTGLGLPIVRGLAEAHGGRVTLESKLKQGTRVTITLPGALIAPPSPVALAS